MRDDFVAVCREHGPTGPEDRSAGIGSDDLVYFVIEDQRNDERYQYVEVNRPQGMTEDWLLDVAAFLREWRHWGVGVCNIPEGYFLIFADRLLVTGKPFKRCRTVAQAVAQARANLSLDEMIQNCRTDADLKRLSEVPGIAKLPILGLRELRKVSDSGLPYLARLRQVRWVNMDGSRVTDAGLAHLEALTRLEDVWLQGTRVSDAGLVHLRKLPRLKQLHLDDCRRVTDAGLAILADMTRLEELGLGGTKVTDAGLAHLQGLKRLRELFLNGCRITDEGLAHLSGLTRLERLYLYQTKITDSGLEHLRRLRRLDILNVRDTKVTPAGAADFEKARPGCQVDVDED
jgi:hypothetical protein